MKQLSWGDVKVRQYIDIYKLSKEEELDDLDKAERCIGIMYGLTPMQIDELKVGEFDAMAHECAKIMTGKIGGKVQRVIKAGGRKYAIEYDPTKLKHRQFVEIQHFAGDGMIENMHLIMASIVKPVSVFGSAKPNIAEDHAKYASDLLEAKVQDIYNSCVFFCKLYINSLSRIKGFLVIEMMKKGATKDQAEKLLMLSLDAMDGFIAPEKSQPLKVFH